MTRPIILTTLGCFWPGNDSSGPNQSFNALTKALHDDFDFKVIALDREHGAQKTLLDCTQKIGKWHLKDHYSICYLKLNSLGMAKGLKDVLKETPHDILSLNGFFAQDFTIPSLLLRKFKLIPQRPTLLAPRGEFSPGALDIKSKKKNAYLALNRILALTQSVYLHATSKKEAEFFKQASLPCKKILTAPNLSHFFDIERGHQGSLSGELKIAFLARITPVKNLIYAFDTLKKAQAKIQFDIYGPISDKEYWLECQKFISTMPDHITINYKGVLEYKDIPQRLGQYDLFFLPTKGENFGHAIHEALMCGMPVLISDQTPWRNLENFGVGWDIPLEQQESFIACIDKFASLSPQHKNEYSITARSYAEKRWKETNAIEKSKTMFETLLNNA